MFFLDASGRQKVFTRFLHELRVRPLGSRYHLQLLSRSAKQDKDAEDFGQVDGEEVGEELVCNERSHRQERVDR